MHKPCPNPIYPLTSISYSLPEDIEVNLMVYNITGEPVEVLVLIIQIAGNHSIEWNAESLPSDVCFVKLNAGEFTQTQKVMLIK